MTTEKGLFREVNSDLLSDSDIRGEHELLHEVVRFSRLGSAAIDRHASLIKLEGHFVVLSADCTALEPPLPHLLREIVKEIGRAHV